MNRLNHISKSLAIIGEGKFTYAQNILKASKRKQVHDELDNIHRVAYNLTQQLDKMHTDLKESNLQLLENINEISYLADHDTLTGLFNRRRFNKELQYTCSNNNPFFLISIDINHFKLVNDSLGHSIGDSLLQDVANILKSVITKNGIIGRMGGDEFSVIFSGDKNQINKTITLFIDKVSEIVVGNTNSFKVSSSIGIACYPKDTSSIKELIVYSDAAMYENKRFKSSHFNYYSGNETLINEEKESQHWNRIINHALSANKIHPYFQPIFHRRTRKIYSYEVLARIKNDNQLLSPQLYMDHLERNRSIINFDKMIIDCTLEKLYKNPEKERLMINLSYYTIATPKLDDFIIERCSYYNYPPEKITFEITERVEVTNLSIANKFIKKLKRHGFSFALDDFGAGFSSFFYLTELPIDYLKIDKKITAGLISNPNDHHIVHSIIILAKNLNIKIIAEGIDSIELLNIVSKYEINFLQGYFLSMPKPINEIPRDVAPAAALTFQDPSTLPP